MDFRRSNVEAGNQAKVALKEAYALCDELRDDGLRAEATMTEGLLVASVQRNRASGDSLKLLLEARTLCQQVYGEFSTLMARLEGRGRMLEQKETETMNV